MTPKDRTVVAMDLISEALKALIRIDYGNAVQSTRNMGAAADCLGRAAAALTRENLK